MTRPSARKKVKNPRLKVTRRTQDKHFKPKAVVHPVLAKVWDKKKTLAQNYEAIGLSLNLNSAAIPGSSGKGKVLETALPSSSSSSSESSDALPTPALLTEKGKRIPITDLSATMHTGVVLQAAKIKRDAKGNVIGYDVDDLNPMDSAFDEVLARAQEAKPKTKTVQELIALAQNGVTSFKFPSSGQLDWLHKLVQKYGDDTQKMARDRHLNVNQHTPAQLTRKLKAYWNFLRAYEVEDVTELTK
ncbi:ribosome biogenesis protein Nop16 [Catenaria anguillulae PL171]|uniref:Nucleolar protein 16 n=1 Tax=Catenaria anguillulae PL171 TaxID=765915 RepID=A0A1Y2H8J2_9FUNG|nr:ribosome biogenesis protein Nop16 [Catenaria anguillulae PL171]